MPAPRDPATLMRAAQLYYIEGQSQAQIAKAMDTSRSNVSRMLSDAQRQGIVEIRIHDPIGRNRDLELDLKRAFGLREVLVASRQSGGAARVHEQVGNLASTLLKHHLSEASTIAMSWGESLQAMVWATTVEHDYNVQVVQLVGGLGAVANEISGHELVRELATRLGASYRILHSPATFSTTEARDVMLSEPSVANALTTAKDADLAFVGIGTPTQGSSAALLTNLALTPDEEKEFWAAEPVGDVAARYYNAAGQPVRGAVEDHVLAVGLNELIAIPNVIGVASGRAKTLGVLGALRGHLIDSLVCDESLARSVLSEFRHGGDL